MQAARREAKERTRASGSRAVGRSAETTRRPIRTRSDRNRTIEDRETRRASWRKASALRYHLVHIGLPGGVDLFLVVRMGHLRRGHGCRRVLSSRWPTPQRSFVSEPP